MAGVVHCLSFDVGTRRLGAAVLDVTATTACVRAWLVVDVPTRAGVELNINEATIEELVPLFARVLPPLLAELMAASSAPPSRLVAFIEIQPLNMLLKKKGRGGAADGLRSASNEKTKSLSHILQYELCRLGVEAHFVSSKLKLRGMPPLDAELSSEQRYDANKAYAKERTLALLAAAPQHEGWHAWFAALRIVDGRADAADALLQGIEASRDRLAAQQKALRRLLLGLLLRLL